MVRATIGTTSFIVEAVDDQIRIDGQPFPMDLVKIRANHFSIICNGKSYRAEIVNADRGSKVFKIRINDSHYDVIVKDKSDLLLESMGMNNTRGSHINSIRAPMPGLIIDMKIKEGDEVRKNDPLIVLEAMKMENIIKSPGDGTVKTIHVKKGVSVEKNQILVEF